MFKSHLIVVDKGKHDITSPDVSWCQVESKYMVTKEGLLIGPQGSLRANQQPLLRDHIF